MAREDELSLFRRRMEDFISSVDRVATPKHRKCAPSAAHCAESIQKRNSRRSTLDARRLQKVTFQRSISHLAKDVLTADDYRLCRAGLNSQEHHELEKKYGPTMLAFVFGE